MQAFHTINSVVIPLPMKDVDTDMIIPAQYLTKINRDGYGKFLFQRLKENDENFVFNKNQYRTANILLTQSNFGCGSSREHAVWALQQVGIKVIIAESFSDIFFSNAEKNGLLLITLSSAEIDKLFNAAKYDGFIVTVNLENQTIQSSNNDFLTFDYDPFRKTCLLNGFDDMDYLLNRISEIDNFQARQKESDHE